MLLAAQNAHMNQSFALFETAEFLLPWHSPRLRAPFPLRIIGVHFFTARVRPFCTLFLNKNNTSVRHVSYCNRTNRGRTEAGGVRGKGPGTICVFKWDEVTGE